jgi:hypothetical protein
MLKIFSPENSRWCHDFVMTGKWLQPFPETYPQFSTVPTMTAISSNTYRDLRITRSHYSTRCSPHFPPLRKHLSKIKIYLIWSLQHYNSGLLISNNLFHGFQASAAKQTSAALFWVITQRVLIIPYGRFETTYRVPSERFKNSWPLQDETDRLFLNVGKELLLLAA